VVKEHAIPAGMVEGHEKEIDPAVSTVEAAGVAVTITVPEAFGARDNVPGLIVVVNAPVRWTTRGVMTVGR
jgi:hypothetical protein